MRVYEGNGLGDVYLQLIRDLSSAIGRTCTVRGNEMLEFTEPITLVYKEPGACWMNIPGRRFNPFFAVAEIYWILSGMGSADWIGYYNKRMLSFRDGEKDELHGAYGTRIRHWDNSNSDFHCEIDQIEQVLKKFKEDPNTRQAVICMWDPVRDNLVRSKDIPCNDMIYFTLRNGKLDQTVIQRSNDMIWGTPYNAIQYTHIHALIAGHLGVEMGTFTYVIQNLHIYWDNYKATLAHLMELAHFEEAALSVSSRKKLYSTKVRSFNTLDETSFERLKAEVAVIYEYWNPKYFFRPIYFNSSVTDSKNMYWNHTLPNVLWIYRVLKEGKDLTCEEKKLIATNILNLEEPFPALIMDFLETANIGENFKDVYNQCRSILTVA